MPRNHVSPHQVLIDKLKDIPTIRRNMVVTSNVDDGAMFSPYGRVWKILDPFHILVINCTKYINIYHPDDLEIHDYNGRPRPGSEYKIFDYMPSLRKLKQMNSYSHGTIWEKERNRNVLPCCNLSFGGRYHNDRFSDPVHCHLKKMEHENE